MILLTLGLRGCHLMKELLRLSYGLGTLSFRQPVERFFFSRLGALTSMSFAPRDSITLVFD